MERRTGGGSRPARVPYRQGLRLLRQAVCWQNERNSGLTRARLRGNGGQEKQGHRDQQRHCGQEAPKLWIVKEDWPYQWKEKDRRLTPAERRFYWKAELERAGQRERVGEVRGERRNGKRKAKR